jgi:hypothetical protein
VDVLWITQTDKNQMKEVPRNMDGWSCPATINGVASTGQQCWDLFVAAFGLVLIQQDGTAIAAPYEDKTIYFRPSCAAHVPSGITGGQNFGILAKIPVLVK